MHAISYALLLLLVVLCSLHPAALRAATETITREFTGYGESPEHAITNALIEGIHQVRGIAMETAEKLRIEFNKESTKTVKEEKGVTDDTFAYTVERARDYKRRILSKAEGYVKTYQISSLEYQSEGSQWVAVILAEIPRYLSPEQGRSRMATMAVLPFRVALAEYLIADTRLDSTEAARRLNHALTSEMIQARRFRLLEREYLSEFYQEQNIIKFGDLPVEETLRLGHRLGADFVLVGRILEFSGTEAQKTVVGVVTTDRELSLAIEFRVVDIAHQEIRWSNTLRFRLDDESLNQLATSSSAGVADAVLSRAAATIASEILDVIYPVRVLLTEGGEVTLNRGGIRVKAGDVYNVFTSGRIVADPETGRKAVLDGPVVATVQISDVQPKFSVAKVISGNINDIEWYAICRLEQARSGKQDSGIDDKTIKW